jgi:hypothetical protein
MGYARKGMRVLHLFLAESLYEQALHAGDREVPPVVKTTSISSGASPAFCIVSSIQGRHADRS